MKALYSASKCGRPAQLALALAENAARESSCEAGEISKQLAAAGAKPEEAARRSNESGVMKYEIAKKYGEMVTMAKYQW